MQVWWISNSTLHMYFGSFERATQQRNHRWNILTWREPTINKVLWSGTGSLHELNSMLKPQHAQTPQNDFETASGPTFVIEKDNVEKSNKLRREALEPDNTIVGEVILLMLKRSQKLVAQIRNKSIEFHFFYFHCLNLMVLSNFQTLFTVWKSNFALYNFATTKLYVSST